MKKDFVMHLMRMTLVIVMFFCGAGSAFAQSETQSENDYFSLTKNAGTEERGDGEREHHVLPDAGGCRQ